MKFLIALLVFASAAVFVEPLPPFASMPSQQGLARLFFQSRTTAQDPLVSMACFADYIAHSNVISKNYGVKYNGCLVKATKSRNEVDQEVIRERTGIEATSEGVCKRIRTCNEYNSTLDMFNCHANMGSDNTKATYAISGNASDYATLLQERYRLINLHHEQCCHAAERSYVEETAVNYNHLQSCLDGHVKPRPSSTTTTSSTSTTTTTSTTEAPPPEEAETEIPVTEIPPGAEEQFAQIVNMLN